MGEKNIKRRLRRFLEKKGLSEDLIDWEAYIDSSLSDSENIEIIKEEYMLGNDYEDNKFVDMWLKKCEDYYNHVGEQYSIFDFADKEAVRELERELKEQGIEIESGDENINTFGDNNYNMNIEFLLSNDDYVNHLRKIIERVKDISNYDKLGFEWHQVGISPRSLVKLVEEGFLEIVYKSSKHTNYKLVIEPEKMREILDRVEKMKKEGLKDPVKEINTDGLFNDIVGYDDIKFLILNTLKHNIRVHFLFVGSPGSAKTMFLMDLMKAGGYYIVGSTTSKAGLSEILKMNKPKILIIDELDKMSREDMAVLLSLMETGIITYTKKGNHYRFELDTIVFAACNDINKLPRELVSRFVVFNFKEYSLKDLIKIAKEKYGEIGGYIAYEVYNQLGSTDFRDVKKVYELASNMGGDLEKNVDRVISILAKYKV